MIDSPWHSTRLIEVDQQLYSFRNTEVELCIIWDELVVDG